jgi:hypothetical protein
MRVNEAKMMGEVTEYKEQLKDKKEFIDRLIKTIAA